MKIAEDGQTTGMSIILIDKLTSMDVFKRPVHCCDVKNETIYIKDQDIWEKEEKNKPRLKNILDKIIKKSIDDDNSSNEELITCLNFTNEISKALKHN